MGSVLPRSRPGDQQKLKRHLQSAEKTVLDLFAEDDSTLHGKAEIQQLHAV